MRRFLTILTWLTLIVMPVAATLANEKELVVRLAKLEIHPEHLENYKMALKEEIETSVRLEPGVLSLYAVAEKSHPNRITIFETYANETAYRAHLETPHFKKYKTATFKMIKSLDLVETLPVILKGK